MRRLPSIFLIAACFVAGFVFSAPANAEAKAKVGIADQKADMFDDERFGALGLKFARLAVPWDSQRYDFTKDEVDLWITKARSQGITPLITFQRSRVKPHSRPTVQQYTSEFKKFKKKYPFIKNYAAWNEPNLEDSKRPKLIASYYKALKANCFNCKVLAGDLVDRKNMIPWVKQFNSYLKVKPKYWGLHNYVSANQFSTKATKELMTTAKGSQIWLTETGGLVARRNKSDIKLKQGKAHAAKVTSFILKTWGNNPRIPFIFLYHWDSTSNKDTWDSAFVGPDGKARPSLGVLKGYLGK